MKNMLLTGIVLILGILSANTILAQSSEQLKISFSSDPREGEPVTVIVSPNPANLGINKVDLFYRIPGDKYQSREMKFDKGSYVYTIPASESVPPTIEYYVIATKTTGEKLVFPSISSENPEVDIENSPAQLTIRTIQGEEGVTILMGEPGSVVASEDFIIMLSYYRISENIDVKSIKLLVNGADVTSKSTITKDALTYLPETPPAPGQMEMSFSAKLKDGTIVGPVNWKSSTATEKEAEAIEEEEKKFNMSGNVWDELRYENLAGTGTGYHRANLSVSGNWQWLNFSTNLYGTSEEKGYLQPANRYSLKLMSDYLDLGFGDVYPAFSRLVMNGTRVRGLELNLKAKAVNIDFTYGQTVRGIEASFLEGSSIVSNGDPTQKDTLETKGYILIDGVYKLRTDLGTYEKNLLAAKLSFGDKLEGFNWGLTYLQSKDDTASNKYGGNAAANLALGTDMQLLLDNNRFSWYADAALSLNNTDTRGSLGALDSSLDDLPVSRETIGKYLIPISAGISAPLSVKQIMDYTAIQTGIKLNYWNNYFKGEFLRNGASYTSDGLSFLQNDIMGIKISDRLRLLSNKLILSVGFDRLTDNLNEAKDYRVAIAPGDTTSISGTTVRKTIRTGLAVFPGGKWPSLSFDFVKNDNLNELPDSANASANNASNTVSISSSYSFSSGSNYHTVTVSFSNTSKTDSRDRAIFLNRYGISPVDQKNRSIFLSYGLTVGNDLSLGGSFTNAFSSYDVAIPQLGDSAKGKDSNYAKAETKETSFNIFEVNAVKMLFDNKLKVGGRANMTLSDNNQYLLGGNVEYNIIKNLYATYDINYFVNAGTDNDFITALRLQWVF